MVNNCVPLMLTNKYGNKYSGIWDKMDKVYENNKENPNPDYYAETMQLISQYNGNENLIRNFGGMRAMIIPPSNMNLTEEPGIIDALYKWRVHKQIYKFPKEFEQLLYQQEDGFDTPIWILNSLPYNSIYVETNCLDENVLGFFMYKDYQSYSVVIIYDDMTHENAGFNYNHLTSELTTLEDALNQQLDKEGLGNVGLEACMTTTVWRLMPKILQLVLYICAENKEVEENPEQKKITRKPKDKKFIKDKYREVQIWDCGNKISEKIRTFLVSNKHNNDVVSQRNTFGTGKSKAPHSRRGHWHHFWTGKIGTETRKLILKWVAPTFVNGTPNTVNINIVETEQ